MGTVLSRKELSTLRVNAWLLSLYTGSFYRRQQLLLLLLLTKHHCS